MAEQLPEITNDILDQWEASADQDASMGLPWSVNPLAILAVVKEMRTLRSLLVIVEGHHVLTHQEPLADLFQPNWKGQKVLRRAGCYERGSRPGDGPLYLSPPVPA